MKSGSKKGKQGQTADNNGAAAEIAPPKRTATRRPAAAKKASVSGKKKAPKTASKSPMEATAAMEPTDAEIRMRAYFIAERRHRLGLPGDSNSDWLEAKRQLISETGPR